MEQANNEPQSPFAERLMYCIKERGWLFGIPKTLSQLPFNIDAFVSFVVELLVIHSHYETLSEGLH